MIQYHKSSLSCIAGRRKVTNLVAATTTLPARTTISVDPTRTRSKSTPDLVDTEVNACGKFTLPVPMVEETETKWDSSGTFMSHMVCLIYILRSTRSCCETACFWSHFNKNTYMAIIFYRTQKSL